MAASINNSGATRFQFFFRAQGFHKGAKIDWNCIQRLENCFQENDTQNVIEYVKQTNKKKKKKFNFWKLLEND